MAIHPLVRRLQGLYLKAPDIDLSEEKVREFDAIYRRTTPDRRSRAIQFDLPCPKYEFLQYLVEHRGVLLHGSNATDIDTLMPIRLSTDVRPVGRLNVVYACSDGIWPLFFAILNRRRYFGSTSNDCLWADDGNGIRRRLYYFSVEGAWLRQESEPWIEGMIYIVPRYSFRRLKDEAGAALEEWASDQPVSVLSKLPVRPEDFPFLDSIRVHQPRTPALAINELRIDTDRLDAYRGRYEVAPGLWVRIKRNGQRLCAEANGFRPVEMQAESESVFYINALDLRLAFTTGEDGRVLECKLLLDRFQ